MADVKPKFPYLKRGEGTFKRVHASKFAAQRRISAPHSNKVDLAAAVQEWEGAAGAGSAGSAQATSDVSANRQHAAPGRAPDSTDEPDGREATPAAQNLPARCVQSARPTVRFADTAPAELSAEEQEFAMLERQIRMENSAGGISDCDGDDLSGHRMPDFQPRVYPAPHLSRPQSAQRPRSANLAVGKPALRHPRAHGQAFDQSAALQSYPEDWDDGGAAEPTRAMHRTLLASMPPLPTAGAQQQQEADADVATAALQAVRAMPRPLSGIPAPAESPAAVPPQYQANSRLPPATSPLAEVAAQERMGKLQEELGRLRMEREHAAAVRANMEQASKALQQERAAFEAHKATVTAAQEAEAAREAERLRRERAALERQSRSLTKLPSRKERSEIEALEAVVEQARKDGKARDARHKLTVERLRRQIVSLQELCTGLKSEASGLSRENEQLRADLAKKSKRRNRATAAAACQCSLLPDRPAAVAHLERVPASDRLLKPSVPAAHRVLQPDENTDSNIAVGVPVHLGLASTATRADLCLPAAGFGTSSQPHTLAVRESSPLAAEPRVCLNVPTGKVADGHYSPAAPLVTDRPASLHAATATASQSSLEQPSSSQLWHGAYPSSCGRMIDEEPRPATASCMSDPNGGDMFQISAGQLAEVAAIQAELSASRGPARPVAAPGPASAWPASVDVRPNGPVEDVGGSASGVDKRASYVLRAAWHRDGCNVEPAKSPATWSQPSGTSQDAPHRPLSPPCTLVQTASTSKREEVYPDGRRKVTFANGTTKYLLPDGLSMVTFANGDIKKQLPCGTVEYFYKEVDTWHTTLPSRIEVFYFPNGQTEAHHVDGSKEILFPDGTLRSVLQDGTESVLDAARLSEAVLTPQPQAIEWLADE